MAEQFIEDIYSYAHIISNLRCAINKINSGARYQGLTIIRSQLRGLERFCNACIDDQYEEAGTLKINLLKMDELSDIILMSDILQQAILPIMERWMQSWVQISEKVDDRYLLQTSRCGFLTLKDCISDRYYCSAVDPMYEAYKRIEATFDYTKSSYTVWGAGLGYHVYQLYCYSDGSIPIKLYEPNAQILSYAMQYGVLSWVPAQCLQILSEEEARENVSCNVRSEGYHYLVPYAESIKNEESQQFWIQQYKQGRNGCL